MFVFVWFFIPETKGVSLEAMDQLFGVTDAGPKQVGDDETHEHKDEIRTTENRIELKA